MSNRRQWKRLAKELPLELAIADGSGRVIQAIGSHLNPSGVFVKLADPPAPGTPVKITLSGGGDALAAEGEVVGQVPLDQESARTPGVGVRLQTGPAWTQLYKWLISLESDSTPGAASGDGSDEPDVS